MEADDHNEKQLFFSRKKLLDAFEEYKNRILVRYVAYQLIHNS